MQNYIQKLNVFQIYIRFFYSFGLKILDALGISENKKSEKKLRGGLLTSLEIAIIIPVIVTALNCFLVSLNLGSTLVDFVPLYLIL